MQWNKFSKDDIKLTNHNLVTGWIPVLADNFGNVHVLFATDAVTPSAYSAFNVVSFNIMEYHIILFYFMEYYKFLLVVFLLCFPTTTLMNKIMISFIIVVDVDERRADL